jgi:hypothetical protein
MTLSARQLIDRVRQMLLGVALIALVAAAVLGSVAPAMLVGAWRLAVWASLAPAMGSRLFALIYRTTGGRWGDALEPFLAAGIRIAPWSWALVLPLVFFVKEPAASAFSYESRAMFAVRAVMGLMIITFFARKLLRSRSVAPPWLGPVGLIALVFTLHILADDWLIALEPGWHSTAFPLVWMTGQAVAGLACAVLVALAFGVSPSERSDAGRALGLDLGNLLLAAMLVWCYVTFAQFLIVWAGNLPREISWFQHRAENGWELVPPLLALVHFALPFAFLLSRSWKRSRAMLGVTAAILLGAQLLFTAWLILPAFPATSVPGRWLQIALPIAALGWVFNRYVAGAQRAFASS